MYKWSVPKSKSSTSLLSLPQVSLFINSFVKWLQRDGTGRNLFLNTPRFMEGRKAADSFLQVWGHSHISKFGWSSPPCPGYSKSHWSAKALLTAALVGLGFSPLGLEDISSSMWVSHHSLHRTAFLLSETKQNGIGICFRHIHTLFCPTWWQRCTALLGKAAALDKPHQTLPGISRLLWACSSELPIASWTGKEWTVRACLPKTLRWMVASCSPALFSAMQMYSASSLLSTFLIMSSDPS